MFAFLASVFGVALLVFALHGAHKLPPSSFKAFYCAGTAALQHRDPYTIEPLRSCERTVAPAALPAYAVEPAPLPAYALAPWMLAARLTPGAAQTAYITLLIAALAVLSWAISKLAPLEPTLVFVALLASWFLNLSYNELPPIATACIALCALMLARRRPWLAAIFAAGAAIQPHLALPLWIALVLFAPALRLPLVVAGVVLLAVDLLVGGPHGALEYLLQALPAQAVAEVHANDQYSLTHAAILAGLPMSIALRIGMLSYIAMLAAGVFVAQRLATRNAPEYLALVPPAFVLVGGTFVHDIQFFAALPLALVLLARGVRPNVILLCATVLLAVAWNEATGRLILLLSGASAFAVAWIALPRRSPRALLCGTIALAAMVFVIALNRVPTAVGTPTQTPAAASVNPNDQAAIAWSAYIANTPALSTPSLRSLATKVPTWTGILLLALAASQLARGPRLPVRTARGETVDMTVRAGPLGST